MFGTVEREAPERSKRTAGQQYRAMLRLWSEADTQAAVRGTAWAGYQAVVEYIDHLAPVRTKTDPQTARAARLLTTEQPNRLKEAAWLAATAMI